MSSLGKTIRLSRIFSHASGRILSVAVDHLINYPINLPPGLRKMADTLEGIVEGHADAITMNKGIALRFMPALAGRIPLIIQSMAIRPDASIYADHATPEEVVAMGAEAIAVSIFLGGAEELSYIRHLSAVVRAAEPLGLPVIPHIYPLASGDEHKTVVHDPENIFYAVRMGLEMGADVIKVPYTGDEASFRDIVAATPVPVVAAGGPKCETLDQAEGMVRAVARTGAAGATVGRNVWGFRDIAGSVRTLRAAMQEEV